MKKKYKILSLLSIIGVTAYNCTPNVGHNFFNSGTFITSVRFPENSFHTKAIPNNTSSIVVKVEGSGIDFNSPIFFELTRENPRKVLNEVPEGSKKVSAKAYDSQGNFLAAGDNTVTIIAKKLNRVEVELKSQTVIKPSATPEPLVSAEPCIVRPDEKDLPLSKTLESAILSAGCKILYPSTMPTISPSPEVTPSPVVTVSPTATPTSNSGGGGSSSNPTTGSASATINVIEQPASDITSGPITIGP